MTAAVCIDRLLPRAPHRTLPPQAGRAARRCVRNPGNRANPPLARTLRRAVLFVDLNGSTGLYEQLGDARAARFVCRILDVCMAAVRQSGGEVVKHTGDGIMAIFIDPTAAAAAAVSIVEQTRHPGREGSWCRVAMTHGDVIAVGTAGQPEYLGQTVNLAARLLELHRPIVVSDEVVQCPGVAESLWDCLLVPLACEPRGIPSTTGAYEARPVTLEATVDSGARHRGSQGDAWLAPSLDSSSPTPSLPAVANRSSTCS